MNSSSCRFHNFRALNTFLVQTMHDTKDDSDGTPFISWFKPTHDPHPYKLPAVCASLSRLSACIGFNMFSLHWTSLYCGHWFVTSHTISVSKPVGKATGFSGPFSFLLFWFLVFVCVRARVVFFVVGFLVFFFGGGGLLFFCNLFICFDIDSGVLFFSFF